MLGDYETQMEYHGRGATAIEKAMTILVSRGFSLQEHSEQHVLATSSGYNNNRQDPLLGASQIELRAGYNNLQLSADLSSARWLQKFVSTFPMILTVVILGIVSIVLSLTTPMGVWVYILLGIFAVDVVIFSIVGKLVGGKIMQNTTNALEQFLNNVVQLADAQLASTHPHEDS
ncbi:MAG: hypothetical protein R3B84_21000 [Zavarzinella sp.]